MLMQNRIDPVMKGELLQLYFKREKRWILAHRWKGIALAYSSTVTEEKPQFWEQIQVGGLMYWWELKFLSNYFNFVSEAGNKVASC